MVATRIDMLLDVGVPNAMIGWWGVGSDEGLKA